MAHDHKGREIVAQSLTVRGLGVGLQKPLQVDPIDVDYGDRLILVLDVNAAAFAYPADKTQHDCVDEAIIADALTCMIVKPTSKLGRDLKKMLNDDYSRQQTVLASMKGQGVVDDEENGLAATKDALEGNGAGKATKARKSAKKAATAT